MCGWGLGVGSLGRKKQAWGSLQCGNISHFQCFYYKNKLIYVKFLYDSSKKTTFQRGSYGIFERVYSLKGKCAPKINEAVLVLLNPCNDILV